MLNQTPLKYKVVQSAQIGSENVFDSDVIFEFVVITEAISIELEDNFAISLNQLHITIRDHVCAVDWQPKLSKLKQILTFKNPGSRTSVIPLPLLLGQNLHS
ncbi:hypothetical protein QUB77_30315 [Microcoleus sp. AT9b-C3]